MTGKLVDTTNKRLANEQKHPVSDWQGAETNGNRLVHEQKPEDATGKPVKIDRESWYNVRDDE